MLLRPVQRLVKTYDGKPGNAVKLVRWEFYFPKPMVFIFSSRGIGKKVKSTFSYDAPLAVFSYFMLSCLFLGWEKVSPILIGNTRE